MADASWLRKAPPVTEGGDDPFAELTKIMGFDPRVPFNHSSRREEAAKPAPQQVAAPNVEASADDLDFSVDLEQELMGVLEPAVAEPEFAPAAYQQAPAYQQSSGGVSQYVGSATVEPDDITLDEQAYGELEAAFDAPEYPAAQAAYETRPAYENVPIEYSEQDEAAFSEYVAADTVEDDASGQQPAYVYQDAVPTAYADAAVTSAGESSFRGFAEDAAASYEQDRAVPAYDADEFSIDDELSAIAEQSYVRAPANAYVETSPAAADDIDEQLFEDELSAVADESYEPAPVMYTETVPVADEYIDEADHHSAALVADLDDALAASFENEQEIEADDDWLSEPEAAVAPAVQPQVYQAASDENDELAGSFDAAMAEVDMDFTAAPAGPAMPLAAQFSLDNADLEEDLEALLDDNFEVGGNAPVEPEATYTQPPARGVHFTKENARLAYDTAPYADEALADVEDEGAYEAAQPVAAFAGEDPKHDEFQALDFSAEDLLAEPEPVQEEVAQDDIDDAIAELAAMVRGYDQPVKAAAAAAPVLAAAPEAATEDYLDIETIDVPEDAVALADDLDIPDIEYAEDAVPGYDHLDAELAAAFGEPAMETVQAAQASEPATPDFDLSSGYDAAAAREAVFQAAPYAVAAGAGLAAARYAQTQGQTGDVRLVRNEPVGRRYEADEFDFEVDPDLEDELALAGDLYAEPQRPPLRRGLMIASIVGGIAVLGAIGAFAFSGGEGLASGEPVLIKADTDPVKVKPENPGGTVVPNTESGVFDRAAGESSGPPKQDALISTEEEPVDMATRFPEELPQPIDESADSVDGGATAAAPAPKGEDRLEQTEVAQADEAGAGETVAVQPRKVRTMIVKSDGSLVPREETDQPETVGSTTAAGSLTDPSISAPAPSAAAQEAPAAAQAETPPPAAAATAEQAPAATGTVPSQDETASTEANAAPAQAPRKATANTPETVPLAPSRPADQPLDIVGEVKPDKVAALEPAAPVATAAGGYSMQIASQPSEAAAKSSYQDLARRYGSVLGGRSANIVKAEIAGKGTFWRVRVPAGSRNEAVRLCEQYKAAGGNCFVSK